jgi:hypothetical protein
VLVRDFVERDTLVAASAALRNLCNLRNLWTAMKTQTFLTKLPALVCAFALVVAQASIVVAQVANIQVQVDQPGAAIPPTLFGLFFEDINFGADGGLYPERVKNRSFEFPEPMMGWKHLGTAL